MDSVSVGHGPTSADDSCRQYRQYAVVGHPATDLPNLSRHLGHPRGPKSATVKAGQLHE